MVELEAYCLVCGKPVLVTITRCYARDLGEVDVDGVLAFKGDDPKDCLIYCSEKCARANNDA